MNPYLTYTRQHLSVFIAELQEFCRQPSISATGEGIDRMAEMVGGRLARLGCSPRMIRINNSHPYVFAEVGHGERTLLIYNHYDVQPVGSQTWIEPPFAARIVKLHERPALVARGVADNKANFLFRVQAVESYLRVYGSLPLKVKFLVEGEEEIGSPHLPDLVDSYRELFSADGCIWESGRKDISGRPLLCLGLKGVLFVKLTCETANDEIHSSWGTLLPNAAQRLTLAVASLFDERGWPMIDGFIEHIAPPTSDDIELLKKIEFDFATAARAYGVRRMPKIDHSDALRRHLFGPAVNICGQQSGYAGQATKTILPRHAEVNLDVRLPYGLMPDTALNLLRQHLNRRGFDDVTVTKLASEPPSKSPPDSQLAGAVAESLRAYYGVEPAIWPLMAASGPMYYLCDAFGIPGITFGAGHEGDNVHGTNEHIFLDNYKEAIEAFGLILENFSGRSPRQLTASVTGHTDRHV